MKHHQDGAPAHDHPSSEPTDGLAPGRRQRVPPLDHKRPAVNGNRKLAPLPKELQLVAEVGQTVGPIPVHLINESDEPVTVTGYNAEVQGNRTENDFEIGPIAGVAEPGGAIAFPVAFSPKEESPADQEHPTGRETTLEVLEHETVVAKMRLRGSARPNSKTKTVEVPTGGPVGLPGTVDEMEAYLHQAVEVMVTDRPRAIELVAAINQRLEDVAAQHLVRERFSGYGLGLTTAMQSIGFARDATRDMEGHLRHGASVNGGWHIRALGQAHEPLQLMTGEIKEAKTIREMHEASPISDATETVVDLATDATFTTGFMLGATKGVYESVLEVFKTIGATLELILDIAKTMILDGLLGVIVTIGDKLENFFSSMPDAATALGAMFETNWDHPSSFERGSFRGEVVGYVVAQAVLALVTCGAIMVAGKWAAVGQLLKVANAAGDITTYATGAVRMVSRIEQAGGTVIQGPWKVRAVAHAAEDLGRDASKAEREAAGIASIDEHRKPKADTPEAMDAKAKAPDDSTPDGPPAPPRVSPNALFQQLMEGSQQLWERPPGQWGPLSRVEPDAQTKMLTEHSARDGFRLRSGPRDGSHDTPPSRVAAVGAYTPRRVMEMLAVGERTPSLPNTLVVVMHYGNPHAFHAFRPTKLRNPAAVGDVADLVSFDHRSLTKILKNGGKLDGIDNIILVNWGSGSVDDGVAQWLANKSKKNVYAPEGSTWEQRQGATTWTRFDPKKHSKRPPLQKKQTGDATTADVQGTADAGVQGDGGSLPFLSQIQAAFGKHDVSGVQAHVGGEAAEACGELGAEAYATGNHVAFGGAPSLHTAAHEAAHVVQQRSGVYLKDGLGDTGDIYEQQADEVADAVVAGESAVCALDDATDRPLGLHERPAQDCADNPGILGNRKDFDDDMRFHPGRMPHTNCYDMRPRAYDPSSHDDRDPIEKVPAVRDALRSMAANSDPSRQFLLSLLPNPLAKKLLNHYIDGSGELYTLTLEEVVESQAIVSLLNCESFLAQVAHTKDPAHKEVPFSTSLGVAGTGATLGNFTAIWRGNVDVAADRSWRFAGSFQISDRYDFDAHDDGSRPLFAELKTRIAGKVIAGTPFKISSPLVPVTQTSDQPVGQWVGTTSINSGPDSNLRPAAGKRRSGDQ